MNSLRPGVRRLSKSERLSHIRRLDRLCVEKFFLITVLKYFTWGSWEKRTILVMLKELRKRELLIAKAYYYGGSLLSGKLNPLTHLNLDFYWSLPLLRVEPCGRRYYFWYRINEATKLIHTMHPGPLLTNLLLEGATLDVYAQMATASVIFLHHLTNTLYEMLYVSRN